ncbi:MAG: DNA internalization-related competence protein ComEC/Rec2 [Acidobacteriota bacterium]
MATLRVSRSAIVCALALWAGAAGGVPLDRGARVLAGLAGCLAVLVGRRLEWSGLAPFCFLLAGLALAQDDRAHGAPRDRTLRVSGTVAELATTRRGWRLALTDGTRVLVPRHGLPDADRFAPGVEPGARISVPVRPFRGGGDPRAQAAARVRVLSPPRGAGRLLALRARIRRAFAARVRSRFAAAGSPDGLARAIVAGDRAALDEHAWRVLRASGLAHLAVVSGLHVGAVSLGLAWLVVPLAGRRHPLRRAAALGAALLLLCLLPAHSPVMRASTMVLLVRVAAVAGRGAGGPSALAATVVVLLAVSPELAGEMSFRLTVAATAAIVLAAEGPGRGRGIRLLCAPWLATWPLLVRLSGQCAPWSVPAQAVAGPALAPALAGGWLAVALGGGPGEAGVLLCRYACRWILAVADVAATLPGSGRIAAPLPLEVAWVVALETALAAWLCAGRPRSRRVGLLACTLLALAPFSPHGSRRLPDAGLAVLDVGQGQAVLIADGPRRVLIDAGPGGPRARRLLHRLRALGVRRLEMLVLTHRDADHVGAAAELLVATAPRSLVAATAMLADPRVVPLLGDAARRGIRVVPVARGASLRCGRTVLRVMHPAPGERGTGNDASLVLRARVGALTAWLPGDAGLAVEHDLVARGGARPVDVLVAAHHGSSGATGQPLLAALRPRIVAVSAGRRDRFGHPADRTVERIARAGARVVTTSGLGSFAIHPVPGGGLRVVALRDY